MVVVEWKDQLESKFELQSPRMFDVLASAGSRAEMELRLATMGLRVDWTPISRRWTWIVNQYPVGRIQ